MRFSGRASCLVVLPIMFAADASAQLRDLKEGRDHPIISRYAGSILIGYEARDFDEFTLPLGPLRRVSTAPARYEPSKSERVEGRRTRLLYVAPENRSPLEVLRNYEQELEKAGFRALYACAGLECGGQEGFLSKFYLYAQNRRLSNAPAGAKGPPGQITKMAFQFPRDQRYLRSRQPQSSELNHGEQVEHADHHLHRVQRD